MSVDLPYINYDEPINSFKQYSLNEEYVGNWIDLGNIYRKTVACGAEPSSNYYSTYTPINIPDLDKVIKIEGIMLKDSGGCYPLPYAAAVNSGEFMLYSVDVAYFTSASGGDGEWDIVIRRGCNSTSGITSLGITQIYVTIYYTKKAT